MAKYDYKCDECGVVEEHKHKMAEEPEIPCPRDPDHGPMRRLISGDFDLAFKGRGFSCNSETTEACDEAFAQAKAEGLDPCVNMSKKRRERRNKEQFARMARERRAREAQEQSQSQGGQGIVTDV